MRRVVATLVIVGSLFAQLSAQRAAPPNLVPANITTLQAPQACDGAYRAGYWSNQTGVTVYLYDLHLYQAASAVVTLDAVVYLSRPTTTTLLRASWGTDAEPQTGRWTVEQFTPSAAIPPGAWITLISACGGAGQTHSTYLGFSYTVQP